MECSIRKWKIEDAAELAEILNNKNVLDNLRDGLPYPYTEKDAAEYISAMLSADGDGAFAFAVIYNGKVAGSVSAFRRDNIHYRTAEVGYYIGESFWNRGIGASALRQLCDYVFKNTDIIRLFAEPFDTNAGSCAILEKNGFELEGIMRRNAVKNGVIMDMRLYAMTR